MPQVADTTAHVNQFATIQLRKRRSTNAAGWLEDILLVVSLVSALLWLGS